MRLQNRAVCYLAIFHSRFWASSRFDPFDESLSLYDRHAMEHLFPADIELHITEEASTYSDISDMEETDTRSREELCMDLLRYVRSKTSHLSSITKILASNKTSSRNKVTQCIATMRFIVNETFDFILQHNNMFNTSLYDFIDKKLARSKGNFFHLSSEEMNLDIMSKTKAVIYKMKVVLVNRKKLGGLHHPGDKKLRILPKDVKSFITLVFRLFCLAGIDNFSVSLLLCNLHHPSLNSQLYAFSDVLEDIVDAAPTTVEMDKCKVKQFENELEIVDIIIRPLITRLEAQADMDVIGAVARMREIQPVLDTIEERPEYLKALRELL